MRLKLMRPRFALTLITLCAALGLSAAAEKAQAASDCLLDHCADKDDAQKPAQKAAPGKPSENAKPSSQAESSGSEDNTRRADTYQHGASKPGDFDFYVLALSWSPGFCETSERSYAQCDAGANLGFVVHGLWPQYEHGFPTDCNTSARSPSRNAVDTVHGLYPDDGLARYEWRRHGTCTGKSPSDYFADVRKAREAVKIPQQFQSAKGEQHWTPVDIERAFMASNDKLKPGMMAVGCRRGMLQDIRICFSKDLGEFRACPEVASRDCRTRDLSVPPMR